MMAFVPFSSTGLRIDLSGLPSSCNVCRLLQKPSRCGTYDKSLFMRHRLPKFLKKCTNATGSSLILLLPKSSTSKPPNAGLHNSSTLVNLFICKWSCLSFGKVLQIGGTKVS